MVRTKHVCKNVGNFPGVNSGPNKLLWSWEVEKCVSVGKKIPSRLFLPFFFFPFRKERSLNSASLFRAAGALCGSPHRCTFCKGPEGRQGRLRGRWRDRRRGQSGTWLPAQQLRGTAEPAAELGAAEERVWGSGPEQVRPQTGPDPCETRAPSSRGVGGRGGTVSPSSWRMVWRREHARWRQFCLLLWIT